MNTNSEISALHREYVSAIFKRVDPATGWAHTRDVAEKMGVSDATVTNTVSRLAESGLVEHRPYKGVRPSKRGRRVAIDWIRRHRLLETFMSDVVGFGWAECHDEAERIQATVSDAFIEKIDAMLGHPTVDPHGTVIPGPKLNWPEPSYRPLSEAATVGQWFEFARVSDRDADLLRYLDRIGVGLGTKMGVDEVLGFDGTVVCRLADGRSQSFSVAAAAAISVVPCDPPADGGTGTG